MEAEGISTIDRGSCCCTLRAASLLMVAACLSFFRSSKSPDSLQQGHENVILCTDYIAI